MYTINFACATSKCDANGLAKIQIWVNVNGQRKTAYLDFKTKPQTFKKQLLQKSCNNVNVFCNQIRNKIDAYYISNPNVTIDEIMQFIKDGFVAKQTIYTLEMLCNDFMKLQSKRAESEITIRTYNKYKLVIDRLYDVVDKNTPATYVTNNDIVLFKQNLINTYHYQNETLVGYMKKLKSVFEWAVLNDKIHKNPFMDIKISRKVKDVVCLTSIELMAIEQLKFDIDRLNYVKDIFLFSCYTGLSFCDLSTLTKADIQCTGDVHYIKRNRAKTDVQYIVPLSTKAMNLLEKYNYNLPVKSNQKTNAYLKEIGDMAGIKKNLHFHLGRHTALTMMLSNGVPIEIVAKIAGHKNIRQTQHYAKVAEQRVLAYASNLN